ncbi:Signal transduction histidine kinase [Flavobacterium segetis]|uniref:histidine kinase n=1 Tax=Flavobacterium segetis TaxID=271157 RepID=A0A1M5ELD8_9FLAO|nr:ATP-binding protein [Flavobacterium segetis]SHF79954.1 Signal transduction histidine kinase [Flavobacterium segetis]
MKWIFIYFLFLSTVLYSQKVEKIDSIAYYSDTNFPVVADNNYKKALQQSQDLVFKAQIINDYNKQASESYNVGKLYYSLNKYNDAIVWLLKSTAFYSKTELNSKHVASYYMLGLCYIAQKNYNRATIYFDKGRSMLAKVDTNQTSILFNLQKGRIFAAQNQLDNALALFNPIIVLPHDAISDDIKAEALYQTGIIEQKKKRILLATNYFKKALDLNSNTENFEQRSKILLALSTTYENMLDKRTAYSYLKQYLNVKERISLRNNIRLGIDDYAKFKESELVSEIKKTNKQIVEQEKTSKFSKLISIFALAIISILSLLSLSLYKNNKIRNQSNLLLQEKNIELEIAKNKAEKASKARAEFLSTVSHELRTPLNAINGIAHLLLEENPRKSQMEYLSSLKYSGDYLTKFINEILEINKIESHSSQIEELNFNLKKLLCDIKNSLKELALTNNNTLILEVDADIPEYLIGDPTKLSQIILNLINNALKFSKDGEVTVIVKLKDKIDDKTKLYFEITDTGIGIPEDKLESVFESFSQASTEVNRKYGGTGLGLTIVKKLIKLLGGKIRVRSVVNQGTTFTFNLEFQIGEKPLEILTSQKNGYESKLKNKKILVVEDNKINQMITKRMLLNKQIICEIIDNGEDAILSAKNNKFDMILMDVHLPGMNGTIAAEMIRNFDKVTPIIALTAISLHENREMLLSFGMNEVITKPFIPEEFYNIIAEHI